MISRYLASARFFWSLAVFYRNMARRMKASYNNWNKPILSRLTAVPERLRRHYADVLAEDGQAEERARELFAG